MTHREHLHLAWSICRQHGEESALDLVREAIRGWASAHGQALKYHETLTRFWVHMVAHAVRQQSEGTSFEAFLESFPELLDKCLPYRYWQPGTLDSEAARVAWVEPDVQALPS